MEVPGPRVFLHVGAPKTGTSQLQDMLFLNREVLRTNGVLYPASSFDDHFMAALDLLGKTWGGLEQRAQGAWRRLLDEVHAFDGHTVVISHEVFAGASAEQAAQAIADLPGQVHVVFTARDLRRQVPAEWQEGVKHRRTMSYAEFCDDISAELPQTESARWFWRVQDVPAVLDRWAAEFSPERVHLVTVPPPGAPRELLVDRFLGLLGIERDWLPATSDRANASMGAAETTVVRRLNQRLPPSELDGEVYRPYVRELLVHRTLAGRPDSVRITVPSRLDGWVEERTGQWLERLGSAGYHVVGDLAELAPDATGDHWSDPDAAPAGDQLEATLTVAETLVRELAALIEHHRHELGALSERHRGELDALTEQHRGELDALTEQHRRELADAQAGRWMRFKQRLVRRAGASRGLGIAYGAYRTLRRR